VRSLNGRGFFGVHYIEKNNSHFEHCSLQRNIKDKVNKTFDKMTGFVKSNFVSSLQQQDKKKNINEEEEVAEEEGVGALAEEVTAGEGAGGNLGKRGKKRRTTSKTVYRSGKNRNSGRRKSLRRKSRRKKTLRKF
jgi:hypothetical protein